jgi:hypothetical protein
MADYQRVSDDVRAEVSSLTYRAHALDGSSWRDHCLRTNLVVNPRPEALQMEGSVKETPTKSNSVAEMDPKVVEQDRLEEDPRPFLKLSLILLMAVFEIPSRSLAMMSEVTPFSQSGKILTLIAKNSNC